MLEINECITPFIFAFKLAILLRISRKEGKSRISPSFVIMLKISSRTTSKFGIDFTHSERFLSSSSFSQEEIACLAFSTHLQKLPKS